MSVLKVLSVTFPLLLVGVERRLDAFDVVVVVVVELTGFVLGVLDRDDVDVCVVESPILFSSTAELIFETVEVRVSFDDSEMLLFMAILDCWVVGPTSLGLEGLVVVVEEVVVSVDGLTDSSFGFFASSLELLLLEYALFLEGDERLIVDSCVTLSFSTVALSSDETTSVDDDDCTLEEMLLDESPRVTEVR